MEKRLIKDPLQLEKTPYEILDIQTIASKQEIESAFKQKIKEGKDTKNALKARNILVDPLKRELVDLFFYNVSFLNQLTPRIRDNNLDLLISRRCDISQVWEIIKKEKFPHIASIHSLAVLWFWWAEYCEINNYRAVNNSSIYNEKGRFTQNVSRAVLWENVISNWIFLIHAKEFWEEWKEIKSIDDHTISVLPQSLEENFINKFNFWKDRYKNIGKNEYAKFFEEYKLLFVAESKAAKEMLKEKVFWKKENKEFFITCGPIMLEQVGIKNDILERYQNNERLKMLLSPFAIVILLIEEKRYEEALNKINDLQIKFPLKDDVNKLKARIYLENGKQHFSLEQFEKAFVSWIEAFKLGGISEEDVQCIVSLCKEESLSHHENAIELLEKMIKVFPVTIYKKSYEELTKILSLLYLQKGIAQIKNAQDRVEKGLIKKIDAKNEMEEGLKEIKKAIELDPSNTSAKGQLEIATGLIDNLDYLDIIADMNANKWEKAIEKLESMPQNSNTLDFLCICYEHVCWFCKGKKKNLCDESKAVEVKMHKIVERNFFWVRWQTATPRISRCGRCYKAHKKSSIFDLMGGILGGVIGIFRGLEGLIIGSLLGIFMGSIYWEIKYGKHVKRKDKALDAPIIKKYRLSGFELGEKPPNVS